MTVKNALAINASGSPLRDRYIRTVPHRGTLTSLDIAKFNYYTQTNSSTTMVQTQDFIITDSISATENIIYVSKGGGTYVIQNEGDARRLADILKNERHDKTTKAVMASHAAHCFIDNLEDILRTYKGASVPGYKIDEVPEILFISDGVVRKVTDAVSANAIAAAYAAMSDKKGVMHIGALLEKACFDADLYNDDGTVKVTEFTLDARNAPAGPCNILLHDGAVLKLDHDASYQFIPADKKSAGLRSRKRPAAPLEFNRYVNASDVLEKFIKFCGESKISIEQFKKLPIELFIVWLVQEAERADGLTTRGEAEKMAKSFNTPKCVACGRFMPKKKAILSMACNDNCLEKAMLINTPAYPILLTA